MPTKTRGNKKKKHNKSSKKVSKRVLGMWKDPTSVWGKNKPLQKFWESLASGKTVVAIYKNGKHKYLKPPNPGTQKSTNFYNQLYDDPEVEAVLSSDLSQDAYTVHLYPKAKDKSVEYVIKNYKKYFESLGSPSMKKLMVPS